MAVKKPVPPLECAVATPMRADVISLQALLHGTADAEQQKRALDFIIHKVCLTYDLTYRPGGDTHASAFAAGRAFAGQELVRFLKMNPRLIEE